jgi:hypothetical protein
MLRAAPHNLLRLMRAFPIYGLALVLDNTGVVEHVRAIRALACPSPGQGKRGGNIAAVAAADGISPSQVVRILRGERWRTNGEAP